MKRGRVWAGLSISSAIATAKSSKEIQLFPSFGGQKLVGPEPELADPLASTNRAEGDRKVLRRSRKAPPFSASPLTSRTPGATSRFEGGGGGAARHDAQRKALAA